MSHSPDMAIIYVVHSSTLRAEMRKHVDTDRNMVVSPGAAFVAFRATAVVFVDKPNAFDLQFDSWRANYKAWVEDVLSLRLVPGYESNIFGVPKEIIAEAQDRIAKIEETHND